MKNKIRKKIFVLESQPVVRDGLAKILEADGEMEMIGEASETTEALRLIAKLNPDLVIIEFPVDEENSLELPKLFRAKFPTLPILIFTSLPETLYAEKALRDGVNGYVMKRESAATVLDAIQHVASGSTYVSPQMNQRILNRLSGPSSEKKSIKDQLGAREFLVFELVGKGYNTRKIAEELNMSMKTVEAHRLHIKTKLKLRDTVSLVQRAIQWVHHESNGTVKTF